MQSSGPLFFAMVNGHGFLHLSAFPADRDGVCTAASTHPVPDPMIFICVSKFRKKTALPQKIPCSAKDSPTKCQSCDSFPIYSSCRQKSIKRVRAGDKLHAIRTGFYRAPGREGCGQKIGSDRRRKSALSIRMRTESPKVSGATTANELTRRRGMATPRRVPDTDGASGSSGSPAPACPER